MPVLLAAGAACSSSPHRSSTSEGTTLLTTSSSSSSPASTTTTALAGSAVTVLPVVPCRTSYGVEPTGTPFVARQLPAAIALGGLSFYSNGRITVLGPAGWACSGLVAADGGQQLDVYEPGRPDLSTHEVPPGTEVIQINSDYTGHGPGAQLICPLFPSSPAATILGPSLPCPARAAREHVVRLSGDVVTFTDPAGVLGSGAGSGGSLATIGAAVYPQITPEPEGGVTVHLLSCTLPATSAEDCDAIKADFLVRNPPNYTPAG
jgi:hypothetical protein